MGEKIGQPVTTETGQPRIPKVIPVTEPAEPPAEVPEEEPVKEPEKEPEKEPVKASDVGSPRAFPGADVDAYKDETEPTDEELESAIRRSARFLGVSEDEVRGMMTRIADRISNAIDDLHREK